MLYPAASRVDIEGDDSSATFSAFLSRSVFMGRLRLLNVQSFQRGLRVESVYECHGCLRRYRMTASESFQERYTANSVITNALREVVTLSYPSDERYTRVHLIVSDPDCVTDLDIAGVNVSWFHLRVIHPTVSTAPNPQRIGIQLPMTSP
jgi:hypothetical protein